MVMDRVSIYIPEGNMKTHKEILIVEDEGDIGSLLKKFLEGNGFSVTLAEDGRPAVGFLKERHFDLLIIDMLLPGEHGMDLVNMKGDNFITPIILISGVYNEADVLLRTKDSSVKFFIKKPFDLDDLLRKVNSAINADQI